MRLHRVLGVVVMVKFGLGALGNVLDFKCPGYGCIEFKCHVEGCIGFMPNHTSIRSYFYLVLMGYR